MYNHLQERLDVDLNCTDRVLELVLLQHSGVENTEGTNDMFLTTDASMDRSSVTGEVCWV